MTVLAPRRTCWRTGASPRVALRMDNEPYYSALSSALRAPEVRIR
jgi:hypothetical protein